MAIALAMLVESRIDENLRQTAVAFQQGETAADRIRSGGALLSALIALFEGQVMQRLIDPKALERILRSPAAAFLRSVGCWRRRSDGVKGGG
ncbi:MAG: hypothetical protein M3285_04490 [Actinomycetota bacterium]|nr:hypothetical protein [Actinomycetota bacterium]